MRRVDLNGKPTAGRLCDFRAFHAQEAGNGGAGEIDIENADGVAGEAEREGELGGYGGFANAAFAREDLCRGWMFSDTKGARVS